MTADWDLLVEWLLRPMPKRLEIWMTASRRLLRLDFRAEDDDVAECPSVYLVAVATGGSQPCE